jgi:hypothetical protein
MDYSDHPALAGDPLYGEDPFDESDYDDRRRWEENGIDLPPEELAELERQAAEQ